MPARRPARLVWHAVLRPAVSDRRSTPVATDSTVGSARHGLEESAPDRTDAVACRDTGDGRTVTVTGTYPVRRHSRPAVSSSPLRRTCRADDACAACHSSRRHGGTLAAGRAGFDGCGPVPESATTPGRSTIRRRAADPSVGCHLPAAAEQPSRRSVSQNAVRVAVRTVMPVPIEYSRMIRIVSLPERQPPDEATLCCPECGHESLKTATGRSTTSRPARRRVSGLWRPGRPPPESGRTDRAKRRVAPVRGRALISAPRTSRLEQRGRAAGSPNSAPVRRPTRRWDYVSSSTNSMPVTSNRAPARSVPTTEMSHP